MNKKSKNLICSMTFFIVLLFMFENSVCSLSIKKKILNEDDATLNMYPVINKGEVIWHKRSGSHFVLYKDGVIEKIDFGSDYNSRYVSKVKSDDGRIVGAYCNQFGSEVCYLENINSSVVPLTHPNQPVVEIEDITDWDFLLDKLVIYNPITDGPYDNVNDLPEGEWTLPIKIFLEYGFNPNDYYDAETIHIPGNELSEEQKEEILEFLDSIVCDCDFYYNFKEDLILSPNTQYSMDLYLVYDGVLDSNGMYIPCSVKKSERVKWFNLDILNW
jgi:hypothetical protein